jgi:hypothetical protein
LELPFKLKSPATLAGRKIGSRLKTTAATGSGHRLQTAFNLKRDDKSYGKARPIAADYVRRNNRAGLLRLTGLTVCKAQSAEGIALSAKNISLPALRAMLHALCLHPNLFLKNAGTS